MHSARYRPLSGALLLLQLLAAPLLAQNQTQNQTPVTPVASAAAMTPDAILATDGFLRPPEPLASAVLAPRHLQVSLSNVSPTGQEFVLTRSVGQPRISDLGKFHYNLAGWFIDPVANRARSMTMATSESIELVRAADGKVVKIQAPAGTKISGARWSPKGDQVAYIVSADKDTHIWVANVADGKTRQVTKQPLLATHVTSFEWTSDGLSFVTVLVPADRGPEPGANGAVAAGPNVRVASTGVENRLRTYNVLLESTKDMQLVEYYSTGQLARVAVKDGAVTKIGQPAMIRTLSSSPDGKYFRVTILQRPFSYLVPLTSFGSREVVWDETGKELVEISKTALRQGEVTPPPAGQTAAAAGGAGGGGGQGGGNDGAKRSLAWRTDGPGMTYLQRDPAPAQNNAQGGRAGAGGNDAAGNAGGNNAGGGNAGGNNAQANQAPRMDHLVHWLPPFTTTSVETVYTTPNQIGSVRYSNDGQTLFITETENNQQHTFALLRSDPSTKHTIARVNGGGAGGRAGGGGGGGGGGGNAGALMMRPGTMGGQVVRISTDGQHVFMTGSGNGAAETDDPDNAEQRGEPRPYIDKINFMTGQKTRIFDGNPAFTETVAAVLNDDVTNIVLQRQNTSMVPQNFNVNLATKQEVQLTQNPDIWTGQLADLKNVQRQVFEARRADGVMVRVRVTLPANFRENSKLPAIFWFYPAEYTSPEAYYRTSRTQNGNGPPTGGPGQGPGRYPTFAPGSIQLFALMGYAVIEPDAPIIGPEGRINDNYVSDLRNNLAAVIDELDRRGIADRNRLALGGHSYGGFSTINAMVHTPFFKAGIAGAPNTNRLLTPFGFQNESRMLWGARDTYLQMSSFLYADRLSGALLMYHGLEDQNVGTNPINSARMFQALEALGKTAALFQYPYEDHSQVAVENRLDMWTRWNAWLDKYVKNAGAVPTTTNTTTEQQNGNGNGGRPN